MAGRSSKVHGARELDEALIALGKTNGKNTLRRGAKRMLEPMRSAAEDNARERTGHLRRAVKIGTRLAKSQKGGGAKRISGTGTFRADPKRDIQMYMGPGQEPQAITEEFGTSDQAPTSFMRRAFEAHAEGAVRAAGPILWEEIGATATRAARKAAKAKR